MIKAAIVGLGWWGKSIVDAVQGKSPDMRFTTGVARDIDTKRDFASRHELALTTDYEAVLADPHIDAVVLATPHSLHPAQVLAAARAGKHVFCEKPLALTANEARAAAAACRAADRVLAVGHNKRFWASMIALREIVAGGSLGQILHVEGHSSNQNSGNFTAWREIPHEAPGGGLTGSGIHVLDALISVAGPVSEVSAQLLTTRAGADPRDTLTVMLGFERGISGSFAAVRSTPLYWRVHVFGDQGSVEALGETQLVIRRPGKAPEHREVAPTHSLQACLESFAQAAQGRGEFLIGMDEIVAASVALEAILQSIDRRSAVRP